MLVADSPLSILVRLLQRLGLCRTDKNGRLDGVRVYQGADFSKEVRQTSNAIIPLFATNLENRHRAEHRMAYPKIFHLLLVIAAVASAQRIFIDAIPAYSELPICAAEQLRTVVKNMEKGCGDDRKTTSYSCFCTDSSSYFSGVISTSVASACLPETTTAVDAAADIFSSYCALGSNGTSGRQQNP